MLDKWLEVCGLALMVLSIVAMVANSWDMAIWAVLAAIYFHLTAKGG